MKTDPSFLVEQNRILHSIWPEWTLMELLNEGSNYVNYKALRQEFTREIFSSIRIIHTNGIPKEKIKDFIYEIKIRISLKGNSHLIEIQDYQVISNENNYDYDIYIRMESLATFQEYCLNYALSSTRVIKLGIDLCNALEINFKNGFYFYIIRPQNIRVRNNCDFVLDGFDLSRYTEEKDVQVLQKDVYDYMAPEVYQRAERELTSDIYSIGLILYRLLNDKRAPFLPPYPQKITCAEDCQSLQYRMTGETMNVPCHAEEKLAKTVLRACSFKPEDRYQTTFDLIQDLSGIKVFKDELLIPGMTSLRQREIKKTSIDKGQLIVRTIFIFVLLGLTIVLIRAGAVINRRIQYIEATPAPISTQSEINQQTTSFTTLELPTGTPTNTAIPTSIPTNTAIPTSIPTNTAIPTSTPTNTAIPTSIPTNTAIPTSTPTNTAIPTSTPTNTAIPTSTPTNTAIPTSTPTPTIISQPESNKPQPPEPPKPGDTKPTKAPKPTKTPKPTKIPKSTK